MTNVVVLTALLAIWPFGGGKDYRMTPSTQVPAATGTVKVTKDKDNGNTAFDIRVEHLAKPANLTPAANSYIVWVRPRGADAVKQGAIGVNDDLKGELKAVTTSKDFDLFVTAEQNQDVSAPRGPEILSTHVNAAS